ncbi:MarR family winged helix-turn-helix transcriptional regulator [Aurantiacibacter sp. D1-12]|uniref:MarR family winged helix-turn-helix transcriptional regulator n=1 Tax=Aurantiacibacter sp. D1-12 TaxID=2993658 RepID=UPI00237CAC7E|nr:MarR family winged helix-turn-helix transcriptional regulator [Aurantiacibacter sp. D1-12]MDE1467832.1 MarR family winged helix-turn-helix transcriptional regulator [Aurantiacibacter sp. D1-12]
MASADFAYDMAADAAGLPISVSIFVDCDLLRGEMGEDVVQAGFKIRECGNLAQLLAGDATVLGEVILVDCPQPDAAAMATLARLDTRAAQSGARLVISTELDSLDAVFGCCAQSNPQILVAPLRAERVIALGRVLAEMPKLRLRELSEDDRLTLLRLTEQVGHIAERLDKIETPKPWGTGKTRNGGAFRFESPGDGYEADGYVSQGLRATGELVRKPRPPLPDARLVRQIIAQRKARAKYLDEELFADPAWDMLLDLTAARVEHQRVCVTSLCIASGVPPTTALRWIGQMTEAGLFERVEDDTDRRRAFIDLTDKAVDAMARYFEEVGRQVLCTA